MTELAARWQRCRGSSEVVDKKALHDLSQVLLLDQLHIPPRQASDLHPKQKFCSPEILHLEATVKKVLDHLDEVHNAPNEEHVVHKQAKNDSLGPLLDGVHTEVGCEPREAALR